MNNFALHKAASLQEASQLDSSENSQIIAGGTNLVDLMKYRIENPNSVIDINQLALAGIEKDDKGGLLLGALATNADTAYHPLVEKQYPVLSQAILSGASQQLRNMATNGGNLMQRTRCYYFYDTATPCNKREPGSGCPAINGFNRIHAILGFSEHCIATHPSDMCVALRALDALIHISGMDGEYQLPIEDFHRLPGDEPQYDHRLKPGDVVTAISLPAEGFASHSHYLKIRDRESYAFALVSVAACLDLEGDTIRDVRVALGGVAHKPWRLREAEEAIIGQQASEENFKKLADHLLQGAQGFGHNDFKLTLAPRAVVRALQQASIQK